jgi:Cys-tRNA(Pro)/Cys-tRNA(Cys) deacylase
MNEVLNIIVEELKKKSVEFELIDLTKRADPYKAFKTLIIKKSSGEYFVVLLPLDKKVDIKQLEKRYGSEISFATAEEVKNVTGVEPGAVCPITLKIPLYIDDSAFRYKKISVGSGDQSYSLAIEPRTLMKLTGAKISKFGRCPITPSENQK